MSEDANIGRDQVEYVANLARLELNDEEMKKFTRQLGDILDYIHMLNQLDTEHVEPMVHVSQQQNVFREDGEPSSIDREDALANAPETLSGFFKVPKVIE